MNTKVSKIPGISFLNNFHFYEDGVRSWKACQIGKGHVYSYASIITRAPEDTELRIIVPFSSQPGCLGVMVMYLYTAHIPIRFMAVNNSIIGIGIVRG